MTTKIRKFIPLPSYLLLLAAVFAIEFVWLAINPNDRPTWLLENTLVLGFVLAIAFSYRAFPLSRVSYTMIFVFLCLHEIGAHYTYAEVPYVDWLSSLGIDLDHERNHYDRLVHFTYGAMLAYPVREIFVRIVDVRGLWGYVLPLDLTISTSALFELIEWGVAEIFGGGLGTAYLGTQGDEWDAQKDMALASLGALIAMSATFAVNSFMQRDFSKELAESLRVKHRRPLDENDIVQRQRAARRGR
jgi:putative membrane protein